MTPLTHTCPACGHRLDPVPLEALCWRGRRLRPAEAKILDLLRRARGDVVRHERLLHAVYGDDPDGGPEDAMDCLRTRIRHLRQAGVPVRSVYGIGYRLGGVRREAKANRAAEAEAARQGQI